MSEVETHKGKLIPMILSGNTLEEKSEAACQELGYSMLGCHKNWLDCLKDEGYRTAYIDEDTETVYRLEDTKLPDYGFAEGSRNEDGSINYFISWYNGGASIDEVLDDVFEQIRQKEKPGLL